MKLWIAAALLATGCYRTAAPAPPPSELRPVVGEPQPTGPVRAHRPPAPARTQITEAFAKMREFTDEMCACTDKACADAVAAEMTQWSTEVGRAFRDEELKPSEDEMKEMTAIAERMGKCMMTLMSAGAPATPPTP